MVDYDQDTGEVIEQRPMLPSMPESRPQNLIFASANPGEVFGALCAMQGTMTAPKRTKDAKVEGKSKYGKDYSYTYKYAPLEEIISAVQKPMAEAGLAYRQFLASRGGQWVMRTVIAHRTGEWFGCDYPIFWDESRGMQGFASGVTYARRYGLMLALGIAAEDDDDANVADGNVATVQDRRQGGSRGTGRAQSSQSAPTTPPPSQAPTAPANGSAEHVGETREDAVRRHNIMKGYIDEAGTAGEVETYMQSQDWKDLAALLRRVEEEKGPKIMASLTKHAETVRDGLQKMEYGNA